MKTNAISLVAAALLLVACQNGNRGANPSGSLEATEVDVVSAIPGRIASIRAELGERVNAGDTLVALDTEVLRLQRVQSAANRESLTAQRAVLNDQLHSAQTSYDLAQTSLDRTEALLQQGSATQQQVDEARAKRDLGRTQISSVRNQLSALDAEEVKLTAALAVFDRQLKDGIVYSPATGTVILRSAEPGEMAAPGSVLLRVADLRTLDLRVYLSETDLGKVKLGQDMAVLVDALPHEILHGTVTWISSEAEFTPKNAQTRDARTQLVYAVKVTLANPDGRLHIGMPAEVKLFS
jgi:HlyD family secretion protein